MAKVSRPINKVSEVEKPKPKLDIDSLLTPEAKARLRDEAADTVRKREIVAAEAEYLKQQMDEIERINHPEVVEEYREITLDFPPYMDRIVLDGRTYMHGGHYSIPKPVFDVMREITWNAFKHDDEIHGRRNSNAYRTERELRMSASSGDIVDKSGRPAVKF